MSCESHELFFTYYLCHIFFILNIELFIIFKMEIKALGQLHFKYYAEVKETECTVRQVLRTSLILWRENVLYL